MGAALPIAGHHDTSELRAMARWEKNGRTASRMVAIAHALDGMTRLAAARLAGMDRQTLRDWVIRYNEDGIAGLHDQPKGYNPEKLSGSEQPFYWRKSFKHPIRHGMAHTPAGFAASAILPRRVWASGSRHRVCRACFSALDSSTKKARSVHPKTDPKAQTDFQKRAAGRAECHRLISGPLNFDRCE